MQDRNLYDNLKNQLSPLRYEGSHPYSKKTEPDEVKLCNYNVTVHKIKKVVHS